MSLFAKTTRDTSKRVVATRFWRAWLAAAMAAVALPFAAATPVHAAPSADLTVVILTGLGSTPDAADDLAGYLRSPMLGRYNVKVYPTLRQGYKETGFLVPESIDVLTDDFARWVAKYVTTPKIVLVAHSMGGLIARSYVKVYDGGAKVQKVILSGTANYGTTSAATGSDYTINGPWLNALNKGDISVGNVKYWSLMTQWDNIVKPFENQWLPRQCPGTGGGWQACAPTASGQGITSSTFDPQWPYVDQPIVGAGSDPQVTNVILQTYCPYSLTQHLGFRDNADAQDVIRQALDGVTSLTSVSCGARPRPIGSFTASVTGGVGPLTVTFDASASRDGDGYVDRYEWKFGDDTTGSGRTISHVFKDKGSYPVVLTVRDEWGTPSVSVQKTIRVD
jgi:PKD repeat protein